MVIAALILFLIAIVLGLNILTSIANNKPTLKSVVFTHGLVALAALLLLTIYMLMGHMHYLLIASILLFILTAVGGFTLFVLDMREKQTSILLAILHPLTAILALIVLISYVLP